MRAAFLAVVVGCGPPVPPRAADLPAEPPPDVDRHFTIWLGGARVGTAVETEAWSRDGVVVRRTETMRFLRGDAPVSLTTTIEIAADRALVPSRVAWTEAGATRRSGGARHDHRGWTVDAPGAPRSVAADAVPAELVSLLVERDGRFAGRVFLPARGFVSGDGRVDPVAPDRLVARLVLDGGAIAEATIDVGRDGSYARVVDGDGVIAIRASAGQAASPYEPVDLIAATSIPIGGAATRTSARRIVLDGDLALPAVPGQAARVAPRGVELVLSPRLPGALPVAEPSPDRTAEIRRLVAQVRRRIAPDLGAGPASPATAGAATSGDCTTYALAYAAHATTRSIPTRVVTGLRVDGDRLVRHRWAVSWTGRAWIAIDAAFGAVPAGGDLIGLAVHDADDVGLVSGEAALTRVRSAGWR